jgi:hypothetical protein
MGCSRKSSISPLRSPGPCDHIGTWNAFHQPIGMTRG